MKLTKTVLKQMIKEQLGKIVETGGLAARGEKATGTHMQVYNAAFTQKALLDLKTAIAELAPIDRGSFLALIVHDGLGFTEEELAALSQGVGRKTVSPDMQPDSDDASQARYTGGVE